MPGYKERFTNLLERTFPDHTFSFQEMGSRLGWGSAKYNELVVDGVASEIRYSLEAKESLSATHGEEGVDALGSMLGHNVSMLLRRQEHPEEPWEVTINKSKETWEERWRSWQSTQS